MATCKDCGCTIGWDCYCENENGDYNRELDQAIYEASRDEPRCPYCHGPNDHGDECRYHVGDLHED